ncbi:hypothetical protein AB0J82_36740 [Asanoa sp. NPDC049518]
MSHDDAGEFGHEQLLEALVRHLLSTDTSTRCAATRAFPGLPIPTASP